MNVFLALWRRELASYFLSPVAYVVLALFLAVMGGIFSLLVSVLAEGPAGVAVMNLLFGSPFFWMTFLIMVPLLTMRLFAEEKRTGTIETLLTAPVTDAQVVLAKYAGAVSFYALMWLPTSLYLMVLQHFSAASAPIDPGPLAGGYLGALLAGMFYLALGLLCSALTSNQVVAAASCFAVMLALFLAGLLDFVARSPLLLAVSTYISSYQHMLDFSRGMVDSRPVVFYLSGTALLLFASVRVLGARSWK